MNRILSTLIVSVLIDSSVWAEQPSIPELKGIKFNIAEVAHSPVQFSVMCSIEAATAFEIESVNLYTVAAGLNTPLLHSTLGISISGEVTPVKTESSTYSFRVSPGAHDIGTSVKSTSVPSSVDLKIQAPIKSGSDYWCIEILPTFRGKLLCTEGPAYEKAIEVAEGNLSQNEQASLKKMRELNAATVASTDLCTFVGERIPETLQAQTKCRSDCWQSHRDMSKKEPLAASRDQICTEMCNRVTPEQVTLATRAFTVCDGLTPIPTVCSLMSKILDVCGSHSEKGCDELARVSSAKCR